MLSSSSLSELSAGNRHTFSGLTSKCMMPWSWMYFKPERSCEKKRAAVRSHSRPLLERRSSESRSPPLANSIVVKHCGPSTCTSRQRTMFGCWSFRSC